jgi:hypothetical protein
MIIHDFDIPNMTFPLLKAYSPLVIDSNASLPFSTARKLFKTIARRNTQLLESFYSVQLGSLLLSDTNDLIIKTSHSVVCKTANVTQRCPGKVSDREVLH